MKTSLKKELVAGHWWLTPEILATQEAAIRRIEVQSQPGEKVRARPYLEKNSSQKKAVGAAQGIGLEFKP
jgi:hypothetical protein